jgi:hypothetical protein
MIFNYFPAISLISTLRHNAVWPTILAAFLLHVIHALIVALQRLLYFFVISAFCLKQRSFLYGLFTVCETTGQLAFL